MKRCEHILTAKRRKSLRRSQVILEQTDMPALTAASGASRNINVGGYEILKLPAGAGSRRGHDETHLEHT